jgi:creatinine amidohydrolase
VYEAARLAWEAGTRVVVLPTIPVGVNTGHAGIPMTLNLNPSTQQAILEDLLDSLEQSYVERLLLVNGHGGNEFKPMLRELGQQYPEMLLATCNWFQSVDKDTFFSAEGDHADEMETSLMMHARPDLVLPLEKAGPGKARKFSLQYLNESWAWMERKWPLATDDTGVGDPRQASAGKGQAYFTAVTEKLASLMQGLAGSRPDDMYA